ncbi:hemerythrin domain-containing protein [Vallicoccus soli]|uniref:Hemerythrin domain-containing protein n=1 Tax=Vallicoccus soli TaxID=2339232 RepID=A0A3A3ZLG7_9ACTN|nr:hemerythrin domain-containing protein [Vallicoccus soli]RJK97002.1 hemerythrin domain-containing protein [Vallicoccus soli]
MTDRPYDSAPGDDVVDVLTRQHRQFLDLVDEIQAAGRPEVRRDLADVLTAELMRHAVAEEMHVYPAVRDHLPDGEAAVEHDTREHQELEEQLKALEGLDAADAQFLEVVGRLEATLRDHVRDEEGEQFPLLRARVPRERMLEMAEQVRRAEQLAPTRPHPAAPHSELFHKLVGPGVGFVDRLRDRLAHRDV